VFRELVGQVEPLPPSERREQLSGAFRSVSPVAKRATVLTVKHLGDQIIGYARGEEAQALALTGEPPRPHRQLDLHRATKEQAQQILTTAVRQARADGLASLLVIVGKGKHSGASGPVLPGAVVETLIRPLARDVLAFRTASPDLGGTGAFVVRLRPMDSR